LYNDILDIHLSVFNNNNKELYQLILAPNGFGQLKKGDGSGLAAEIEALKNKAGKAQYNYLSPQYQMMKFFNGVSGKSGVGNFSSLAMFNAITQGKGLKYVDTSVVDGVVYDDFHLQFGDVKSTGKIGLLKTLPSQKHYDELLKTGMTRRDIDKGYAGDLQGEYYVSKVIEAFQSASVDNEKEQILYKLNINKHTFSAISALAMFGFDEETICYFINQPIIELYVRKAAEKDSSLNDFTANLSGDLFEQIIKDLKTKYNIDADRTATDYGVVELKKLIEVPEVGNKNVRGRDSSF